MSLIGKNEESFVIDFTDKFGERRQGNFATKVWLSAQELILIAVAKDRLSGGSVTLPIPIQGLNATIAELDVRLVDAPKWWKDSRGGRDLLDAQIIYKVDEQMTEAVKKRQDALQKQVEDLEAKVKAQAEKPKEQQNG